MGVEGRAQELKPGRIIPSFRLPGETEIRGWLSFIEIQCPECFPPEWPLR